MSITVQASFQTVDSIVHDPLFLYGSSDDIKFIPGVLLAGVAYPAGSVLGLAATGVNAGKMTLCAFAAGDGSQNPYGILVFPLDLTVATGTGSDANVSIAVTGYFNETALTFGTGYTITLLRQALRNIGIFARAPGYSG